MKHFSKYPMFFVILHIILLQVSFGGDDAEDILSKLQKKYDSIKDASIDFTQNVRFGVTQSEQSFSGKLFMKKDKKYRVELEQQTIVTDGSSVWTYSKLNHQVFIDKYRDDPKSFSPDKIMTNVPENYSAAILGKENIGDHTTIILKLLPKAKRSNIKWMKVWVEEGEWLMRQVQLQDVSDNLTTYIVDTFSINKGLAENQFKFQIPDSTEIIDLR